MDIFSIDLTHNEIVFIRQTLELPSISGRDAKFLASLQIKIENELAEIERIKAEEEQKKARDLQQLIEADQSKSGIKK
jgi:predicted nucleotidyltransferase